MRTLFFSLRNTKEIIRDKLTVIFGLGFPIILLLLLTLIQSNIPVSLFELNHLTPGIAVFGLSFITLFSAMLISKDRSSSFMYRLLTSPMRSSDFILGYTIPLLPIAILQAVICYIVAFLLGLEVTLNVLLAIAVTIPAAVFFIGFGLLCGSLLNEKQVGGLCGALVTNLTAWLSGTWFDIDLLGGVFKQIAYALPFVHAVNAGEAALNGDYSTIMPDLLWVVGYAIVIIIISTIVFKIKKKS